MRNVLILMFLAVFQVFADDTYSQNTTLSLNMDDVTLKNALREIENKSEFYFLYNSKLVNDGRKVNIHFEEQKIDKILAQLFDGTNIEYLVVDRQIILSPVEYMADVKAGLQPQTITGMITDENGAPLPGVYVVVQGTTSGTMTNADGSYSINVTGPDDILEFSFVGMLDQEIQVGNQTRIDVTMEMEVSELEDVIVTGYAVERKKDIVGSVAIVNTDDMNTTASPTLSTKLQGRAAGITVSGTGEGGSVIRVRGFGSFSGSDPLYIIDGVPAASGDDINPEDIESIQILKDAASSSIYGARGANGVIIISTKKGQAGRTRVDVSSYAGINYASRFPDLLNTEELADMFWRSYEGAGYTDADAVSHQQFGTYTTTNNPVIPEYIMVAVTGTPAYGGTALEELRTTSPALFADLTDPANYDFIDHQIVKYAGTTDWYEEAFRNALTQNYQVAVSGGNDQAVFALSANYNDQETTTLYGYNKRLTLRANSAFTIKDILRVGENLQLLYSTERDGVNTGSLYYMMPYMPVKDEYGNWVGMKVPGTKTDMSNPIADASRSDLNRNGTYGFFGNLYLEADIFTGLTLRSSIGVDHRNVFERNFNRKTYENLNNTTYNSLTYRAENNLAWTWTNQATYSKSFGQHVVRLLVGTEFYKSLSEDVSGTTYDFLIENSINFLDLGAGLNEGTHSPATSGTWGDNTLASYFGRFDYAFADKYLLNATLRHDGSPKFSEKYKWGDFPAVGIGWMISEESFMQNISWLQSLKLRGSWGVIGNQSGLDALNQYTTFALNGGAYADGTATGYLSSYSPSRLGNPDAKWEETVTTNIGFDASLFSQKLDVTAELFKKQTDDLLVPYNAPYTGPGASSGGPGGGSTLQQPSVNLGSIQNIGVEAIVTNRGNILPDLRYEATLTFSSYKNKALKIAENEESTYERNEFFGNYLNTTKVGEEIASYYGYVIDGFFNTQAEVDNYTVTGSWITPRVGGWRVKDVNNDGQITTDDKTKIGSPHPDFITSLNLSFSYKNIDLSGFFYWQQGGDKVNVMIYYTDQVTGLYGKSQRLLDNSWTDSNHDAELPKLDDSHSEHFTYLSDYWIEDVSFLRLKTLQLGYTLPASLISRIGLNRCRIYMQASNVFTITGYNNMEPDGSITGQSATSGDLQMGMDRGASPVPKQVIFGVNLSL